MVSVVTPVATGNSCGHVSVATADRVCCNAAVCVSGGHDRVSLLLIGCVVMLLFVCLVDMIECRYC